MVDLLAGGQGEGPKTTMNYSVYIIQILKDNKFYTAITNNIERRLREHNRGTTSTPSTKNRGPFKLIYRENGFTLPEARKREKYLKSGIGREWRKFLPG